jgi:hypothetical protein
MESNNTLMIPQGSRTYIIGILGLLFLPIYLCFVFRTGSISIGFIILSVITLISFSILHIYEYNKEDQSLTIFWGMGFPLGNFFIKLPWVKQSYIRKRITKIEIFHEIDAENPSGVTTSSVDIYPVRAMIGGKWIDIGGEIRVTPILLQRSKEKAYKIGKFLGVPIEDMSSRTRS